MGDNQSKYENSHLESKIQLEPIINRIISKEIKDRKCDLSFIPDKNNITIYKNILINILNQKYKYYTEEEAFEFIENNSETGYIYFLMKDNIFIRENINYVGQTRETLKDRWKTKKSICIYPKKEKYLIDTKYFLFIKEDENKVIDIESFFIKDCFCNPKQNKEKCNYKTALLNEIEYKNAEQRGAEQIITGIGMLFILRIINNIFL